MTRGVGGGGADKRQARVRTIEGLPVRRQLQRRERMAGERGRAARGPRRLSRLSARRVPSRGGRGRCLARRLNNCEQVS